MFENVRSKRYLIALVLFLFIPVLIILTRNWNRFRVQKTHPVVTILAVNDIYQIDGFGEEKLGGLHRLRTLRTWIERNAPNAILLHAGDFLEPGLVSSEFKGRPMIEAMNSLDGDDRAFDQRLFVTFGNHEFDHSECSKEAPLVARVTESQFTWLAANLDFSDCASMRSIPQQSNVAKDRIVEIGSLKIGIFGIARTPEPKDAVRFPRTINAIEAARLAIKELKRNGADVVVALTHLNKPEDEELIRSLSRDGLDLLVGGHDHSQMVLKDDAGTPRGFKADSDARTAWQIDIRVSDGGRPLIEGRLVSLNGAVRPDPHISDIAKRWFVQTDESICVKNKQKSGCFAEKIGSTQTVIELEELANRSQETGFGSWLADQVQEKTRAHVTIINSGSLRLNYDLAAGSAIRREHIVSIFRYDDVVAVREFEARNVCKALQHGFSEATTGAWPHVSGVVATLPKSGPVKAKDIKIEITGLKDVTCDSSDMVRVATLPFVLCGGDHYRFDGKDEEARDQGDECRDDIRKHPNTDGMKLGAMAEKAIRDAGSNGIRPEKTGRVR